VAAVPASRLNEQQIVPDYFEVFGLPRRFGVDRAALERRFYELSRETHPDRFAAGGAAGIRLAMERMSLLNEAYRVLKSPEELRSYFLRLEGHEPEAQTGSSHKQRQQIPAELAESWFELQDAVMEEPESASERIAAFEARLGELRSQGHGQLVEVEREIDRASGDGRKPSSELLDRLASGIRAQSYLKSMERDVERLKGRFAAPLTGAGRESR
jgi:molecular chaperone HscB